MIKLSKYAGFEPGDHVIVNRGDGHAPETGVAVMGDDGFLTVVLTAEISRVDVRGHVYVGANASDAPIPEGLPYPEPGFSLERCECGSGVHVRGPGHSGYCKLYER